MGGDDEWVGWGVGWVRWVGMRWGSIPHVCFEVRSILKGLVNQGVGVYMN